MLRRAVDAAAASRSDLDRVVVHLRELDEMVLDNQREIERFSKSMSELTAAEEAEGERARRHSGNVHVLMMMVCVLAAADDPWGDVTSEEELSISGIEEEEEEAEVDASHGSASATPATPPLAESAPAASPQPPSTRAATPPAPPATVTATPVATTAVASSSDGRPPVTPFSGLTVDVTAAPGQRQQRTSILSNKSSSRRRSSRLRSVPSAAAIAVGHPPVGTHPTTATEFKRLLCGGAMFLKHGRQGRPHARYAVPEAATHLLVLVIHIWPCFSPPPTAWCG